MTSPKDQSASECICGEINARHCPVHQEGKAVYIPDGNKPSAGEGMDDEQLYQLAKNKWPYAPYPCADYFVSGYRTGYNAGSADYENTRTQLACVLVNNGKLEFERNAWREQAEKLFDGLKKILDAGNLAAQGKWDSTSEMKDIAYAQLIEFEAFRKERG